MKKADCYMCIYYDKDGGKYKECSKGRAKPTAMSMFEVCEFFEPAKCCATCQYLSGDCCKLGYIDFSEISKNCYQVFCEADEYAPCELDRSPRSSGGCYIATCVYGSYDCPPVWTLRRYRDSVLSKRVYGRWFVKLYYVISPTLVKWFGKEKWFRRICKAPLDRLVSSLNAKGIDDTSYKDPQ